MNEGTGHEALLALMVRTPDEPGVLHALTKVILDHKALQVAPEGEWRSGARAFSKIGEKVQDDLIKPAGILHVAHMSDARQHDLAGIWNLLQGVGDRMEIWQVTLTDTD
jgi:hypothetical protein